MEMTQLPPTEEIEGEATKETTPEDTVNLRQKRGLDEQTGDSTIGTGGAPLTKILTPFGDPNALDEHEGITGIGQKVYKRFPQKNRIGKWVYNTSSGYTPASVGDYQVA